MASYQKKEEEKKQRREAMAIKYPSQNPRSTVTAILTRKELPTSARIANAVQQWNRSNTVSAVKPKAEKYPLNVNREIKAEPYPLRINKQNGNQELKVVNTIWKPDYNKDFASKAATGWQTFQIDEVNRKYYGTDSGFRRWKEAFGDPGLDDDFYRPSKSWSADANNTFGYLYSQNKEDAYRFAKTLNKAYRQLDDSFENIKAFGQSVLDNHTQAEQRNSEAQTESAKMIGEGWNRAGKWAADKVRTAVTSSADVQAKQAEQAQAQTQGINEIAQNVMNRFTESMRNQSQNSEIFAKQNKKGLYLSGKHSGVTGSDQTGASVHGFRDDTSYKEPSDEWTDGERRLYEYHLKTNPEEAEAYAIRTNNRHNQKAHDAEVQEIKDWTSENGAHGAVAWGGARTTNAVSFLEGYNQLLERSVIGQNTVSRNVMPSEIRDTVDNTNEQNITEKHGAVAGGLYRFGTEVADALIENKMFDQKLGKRNVTVDDVNSVVNGFLEGYQSETKENSNGQDIWNGVKSAGTELIGVITSNKVDDKLGGADENIKTIVSETAGVAAKSAVAGTREWFQQQKNNIDERKNEYMNTQGLNERTAWWKATKELLEEAFYKTRS